MNTDAPLSDIHYGHPDKEKFVSDEKHVGEVADEEDVDTEEVLTDARGLITHVISVDDDPSLNPWTFRVFVIGIGLSAFGGVLGEFCPATAFR